MTTLVWRKSTFTETGNCVEVAWPIERTAVRDSKDPAGRVLVFDRQRFAEFLTVVARA